MSDLNPYEEGLARDLAKAQARIEELEVKLARAVDFIEDLEGHEWPLDVQAKRVVKELKGNDDEYADKWED